MPTQRAAPFLRTHLVKFLTLIIGLIAMNAIFIARAFRQRPTVDPATAGQLGDFVGGYVGAFLSLLGIVLLVAKLKNQIATSQRHFFEGKYFELIKLHRDNAAELELQEANGGRLFVLMVREPRCALAIIQQTARDMKAELTNEEALQIAYYCVYFGVGPNSSRILLKSLPAFPSKLVNAIEEKIRLPIGCFGGVF